MKALLQRLLPPTWKAAWALTLLTLPVTSFPLLSRLAGGTLVAPLALLPLAWLILTCLPTILLSRRPLPAESRPLLVFLAAVLLSSAAAYFIEIPPYKGFTLFGNNLEAFLSLAIGLSFFFVTLALIQDSASQAATLRWIHIGGLILILWSLIQFVAWLIMGEMPSWLVNIQAAISITDLQGNPNHFRLRGTTLEPSWLAHCLNLLYFPLWLAATLQRTSVFRLRLLRLTVENLLLVSGFAVLILAYSRIGLLAFALVLTWLLLRNSPALARRLAHRLLPARPRAARLIQVLLPILLVLVLLLAALSLAYGLSLEDFRFAKLFRSGNAAMALSGNFIAFANRLGIGERVIYWGLGWNVFSAHPLLGVGLGNAGMFGLQDFSYYAWKSPEVLRIINLESYLPNTKSLWTRLLAETGLLGTSIFITWLIVQWTAGRRLKNHPSHLLRTFGLAGQFTLVALLVEGFSVDTFALPYLWISLGLLTSASFLARAPLPVASTP